MGKINKLNCSSSALSTPFNCYLLTIQYKSDPVNLISEIGRIANGYMRLIMFI